ncbi:MAG: YfhO family protein [Bacteroidota bacterium]
MKTDYKKLLPHLYVVLFFIAICAVYFNPVLQGKGLSQHDTEQWEGMAKEIADHRDKFGEEPLWTRSMFGGMPAYQISVLYPNNLVSYVNKVLLLGFPEPYGYVLLSLLGFYILLLCFKLDWRMAAAGAIAYAFSSYNFIILMAGHNSKLHAIALMPFVVAGVVMVFNGRYLFGGAVTAMGLALQIYANHLQITYYLAIGLVILGVVQFFKHLKEGLLGSFMKAAITLVIAAGLAILPNITSLWATMEYGKDTTRGPSELTDKKVSKGLDQDYAFAWSYGIGESLTMLIPDYMGGPSSSDIGKNSETYKAMRDNNAGMQADAFVKQVPLYWGSQSFTAGPVYMGAIVIFLFVLGLMLVRTEYRIWMVIATLLFLFMSWGKHFMGFNDFLFHYLPGYNKFRTVSMSLVVCGLTFVLLAALALKEIFNDQQNIAKRKQALLWSYYIVGGLCLLFASLAPSFMDFSAEVDNQLAQDGKPITWLIDAIREDRASALRTDAFRSFAFISIAFGLLWFSLKGMLKSQNAVLLLALFIMVDLWAVDKRYLDDRNFVSKSRLKQPFEPTEADQAILQDTELGYRVLNTSVSTFNDASTSYLHHSIGGYHGAKLKRYQELIEFQISENNLSVIDMLNTKYIIGNSRETGALMVQPNRQACGAAWFVKEFRMVANADSEMTALTNFNPAQTAIIDKRFEGKLEGLQMQYDSSATIKLVDYRANRLQYQTSALSEQLAVFSEIYYDKGWKAYVDGKEVPHIRVNYVLRAMRIPAGQHKVEFKFEPEVYYTGEKIALAGSLLLILAFVGISVREFRGQSQS